MKKSELTQLTQIIEVLVTREIKKQLPKLIGEVFQNMAGKSMIAEHVKPVRNDCVGKEVEPSVVPKDPHEFRASLKELFSGVTPVTRTELEDGIQLPPPRAIIQYAKDPVLNKILNETTSDLTAKDRFTGMAAFQGGYNPGMPSVAAMAGIGEMMAESEMPAFARGTYFIHKCACFYTEESCAYVSNTRRYFCVGCSKGWYDDPRNNRGTD